MGESVVPRITEHSSLASYRMQLRNRTEVLRERSVDCLMPAASGWWILASNYRRLWGFYFVSSPEQPYPVPLQNSDNIPWRHTDHDLRVTLLSDASSSSTGTSEASPIPFPRENTSMQPQPEPQSALHESQRPPPRNKNIWGLAAWSGRPRILVFTVHFVFVALQCLYKYNYCNLPPFS